MLHKLHLQAYQSFEKTLLELQDLARASNPEPAALLKHFQQVRQVFDRQIMILSEDELEGAIASRWQSVRTEIHRALRLLEMDMLFLNSAKQTATARTRLDSLQARIEQIVGYCQLVRQEI